LLYPSGDLITSFSPSVLVSLGTGIACSAADDNS
jgi:hypothetical protein